MLSWRKEDRSSSSHALLHSVVTSPLLSHDCVGSSEHCHYALPQRFTADQAPVCLQQAGHEPVTNKTSQNIANSRKRAGVVPCQQKDAAYYEKRRKNNESAKKSREARQHKEQVVVAHVQILKEENMRLKAEHKLLSRQSGELLARLYNRSSG